MKTYPWKSLAGVLLLIAAQVLALMPAQATPAFPLRFDPSVHPRHLVDQNDAPFFILGDTMWMWMYTLDSAQAIETYLDDRVTKGFTVIQLMLLSKDTLSIRVPGGSSSTWTVLPDFAGNAPFTQQISTGIWNFDSRNQAYFDSYKWIINECAERGLLVHMSYCWMGAPRQGWHDDLAANSDAQCLNFGRYLGQQFGGCQNLVWMSGGDHLPTATEEARQHKILEGILETTPAGGLHTAHWIRGYYPSAKCVSRDIPSFAPQMNMELCYGAALPYIVSLKGWHAQNLAGLTNPIPAFMGESFYEGTDVNTTSVASEVTPLVVRRQVYWSVLSGTGHIYGARGSYTPGPTTSRWDGVWAYVPDWQTRLNDPGTFHVGLAKNVFLGRAWFDLIPDDTNQVVTGGRGTKSTNDTGAITQTGSDYVTAARTADGTLVMAYVPPTSSVTRTLTVNMTKLSATAAAKWWDPTNGAYSTIGSYANAGSLQFTTPGNNSAGQNDWVLILETTAPATTVATPAISPNGGSFTESVAVTISCATSGATIRYTTDGGTPTSSSATYAGPLTLTATTTLKSRAFKTGLNDSAAATATFTKNVGGGSTVYQAEDALLVGPIVSATNAGYTGTGFADYAATAGDYVEWTVTADHAGDYELAFRYALMPTTDRPLEIKVNGTVAAAGLSFPSTGSRTTWSVSTLNVTLNAGTNTIRAAAMTSAGGGNVDSLTVTALNALPVNYPVIHSATTQYSNYVPANLIDGNTSTLWSTSVYPGGKIVIDYGANLGIAGTRLRTYQNRDYQFLIKVAQDGEDPAIAGSYEVIVDRTGNTATAQPISDDFPAVTGRYVMIEVTGAATYTGSLVSLLEFDIVEGPVAGAGMHLEAEHHDASAGIVTFANRIGGCSSGDWAAYYDLTFNSDWDTVTFNLGSPAAGRQIMLRLDSPTGPLIGTLTTVATGGWTVFAEQTTSIIPTSGTHDLYLVFAGSGGDVGDLDWFKLY